jgi:hypothetical protein
MMHRAGQSVIVRHKEYIGDVVSSDVYAQQRELALNPGLSSSFPWLSSIARQYQEYTWKGMVFHFVPTVGEAVSATVPVYGNVMMHTEYRVTAPAPANKAELLNEYFASDSRPSEPFVHPIECDPKENPYNVQYVRTGPVPSGEDAKTYDLGMFRCCTQGQAAAGSVLGELWVSYEVELRKPQLTSQSGEATQVRGTSTFSTTTPLGSTLTTVYDGIGATVTSGGSAAVVTFNPGVVGKFLILYTWNPTGDLTVTPNTVSAVGLTRLTNMGGTGTDTGALATPTAQHTGASIATCVLTSGAQVQTLAWTFTTITGVNGAMVMITRLPMDA